MRNADPPEVITPASLRMFSSGPGGFLWRCADAWEEDIARREALEKRLTETGVRVEDSLDDLSHVLDMLGATEEQLALSRYTLAQARSDAPSAHLTGSDMGLKTVAAWEDEELEITIPAGGKAIIMECPDCGVLIPHVCAEEAQHDGPR